MRKITDEELDALFERVARDDSVGEISAAEVMRTFRRNQIKMKIVSLEGRDFI